MTTEVKLPELGDGIESGDVLEVFVSVGDTVEKEQGLLELETDKATVTVPSPAAGKVTKIVVQPGQTVPVGGVIVELESASAGGSKSSESKPEPTTAASTAESTEPESSASAPESRSAPVEPAPAPSAPSPKPASPKPASPKPASSKPQFSEATPRAETRQPSPASAAEEPRVKPAPVAPVAAGPAVRRLRERWALIWHMFGEPAKAIGLLERMSWRRCVSQAWLDQPRWSRPAW